MVDEFPDWVPVPDEIENCEFEDGEVSCARVSDTAISLTIGDKYMLKLDGFVGKVKNVPSSKTTEDLKSLFTVNRIDYYSIHENELADGFALSEIPFETTLHDIAYHIDISKGVLEDT